MHCIVCFVFKVKHVLLVKNVPTFGVLRTEMNVFRYAMNRNIFLFLLNKIPIDKASTRDKRKRIFYREDLIQHIHFNNDFFLI